MTQPIRERLQTALGAAYTLERELGGGGMSHVFVATENRLKRKVVVKVLSSELAAAISAERFEREIGMAAALQQANIVPVLTSGESGGLPYYTMPFVEGESLRARVDRGPLPIGDVISVLRDVCKALAYAHGHGVVHRDIKPDNVLLSGGTAVVTDFGIAKAISASRDTQRTPATITRAGTTMGTPAYIAPEQAAGDQSVDHRADIYALGAMAFELLAGETVFSGMTADRVLAAHISERPRDISEVRPDTPQPLADLVMSCLAKVRTRRPQNASDMVRTLESIASITSMPTMSVNTVATGPFSARRAIGVYAGAFVSVAVAAQGASAIIGLPDWVFPGALIVMALGLPAVLWTVYVKRVATATQAESPNAFEILARRAEPYVSWRRTVRAGMLALVVFTLIIGAFMTMRALGIGPAGSLLASGRLRKEEPLLIADFRTSNADTSLGRVVSDAVRAGLTGSSAFSLVSPARIVSALDRMQLARTTRVDSAVAGQIAQREGIKAIVDGDVTGVPGGYIVSIRLIRSDSGVELASFREAGDGPRGLIDAAGKVARALRGKAGESLRSVHALPTLSQATTASLPALQKYSEATRYNAVGSARAVELAREAVALDSTFAQAWSALGAFHSNFGGRQASIDSALTQAHRWRARLTARDQQFIVGRYNALGPGRDHGKAIVAYSALVQAGDTQLAGIALAEEFRARREFALAESLNVAASRLNPTSGTALGNASEMQLNQGKLREAATTVDRLGKLAANYGIARAVILWWARGEYDAVSRTVDSLKRVKSGALRITKGMPASVKLLHGRVHAAYTGDSPFTGGLPGTPVERFNDAALSVLLLGSSSSRIARLDSALAHIPFADMAEADRPFLVAAALLAQTGQPAKARALLERYRAEVKDTSLLRVQQDQVHVALAEIALAEGRPREALEEFRRGDIGWDGAPPHECTPCLPYNLARAYDSAGVRDSAIMNYDRYLATPYWLKYTPLHEPWLLPRINERLGQLYLAQGDTAKAAAAWQKFADLWKGADPEFQPRVAAARDQLRRLRLDAPRR